jgi:transcriptional regulator with GAF, ATPase, and Fis domain
MQELFDAIRRLAPHVRTALVTGETGTGKELVARALHKLGRRRERRFVTSNCSAITETLLECEFFGHDAWRVYGANEARAGLFETADGGTLFLDEIGELPLSAQPKLLRAVEYGEIKRVGASDVKRIDICLIAATNRACATTSTLADSGRIVLSPERRRIRAATAPRAPRGHSLPHRVVRQRILQTLRQTDRRRSARSRAVAPQRALPGNVRELHNVLERSCMESVARMLTNAMS